MQPALAFLVLGGDTIGAGARHYLCVRRSEIALSISRAENTSSFLAGAIRRGQFVYALENGLDGVGRFCVICGRRR